MKKDQVGDAIGGSSWGKAHGNFGSAVAVRAAFRDTKDTGARSGRLAALLALALCAVALTATPASAEPPSAMMGAIEDVSYTSAKVTGTAIPNPGFANFYTFEYSTDEVNWISGPGGEVRSESVSGELTVLIGGTHYFVRLFVHDSLGQGNFSTEPNPSFTTLPVTPPTVVATDDASAVFSTSATALGEVERPANPASPPFDPNSAFNTDCAFEYVTDAQFGETGFEGAPQTACEPENPLTKEGRSKVTAKLTGLAPATTYHLRLSASNAGGADHKDAASTFTTLPVVTEPPTILSIEDASEITNATAKVAGTLERPVGADPALDVHCRFEYVTEAEFQPKDEQQSLTVRATGGTFTLGFEGQTGVPIAFDAPAASVQSALEALSSIGPGAVVVSGGPGDEFGTNPYTIEFAGSLAAKDVEAIAVDPSALTAPGEAEVQPTRDGRPEGFNNPNETACDPNTLTVPGSTAVTNHLLGLAFGTEYHFRLTGSNDAGSDSMKAGDTFTTTTAPLAQTLDVGALRANSADLAARVNPLKAPVEYQFEWGETSSYTAKAPATPEPLDTADDAFHVVRAPITGLQPSMTYHYRVVATNTQTNEISEGADRVFTTLEAVGPSPACPNESSRVGLSATLPDCRAFEWASPGLNGAKPYQDSDKNVLADGSGYTFASIWAPLDTETAEVLENINVGRRGPSGWTVRSITPPAPVTATGYTTTAVQLVAEDFSQSLVSSMQPLGDPVSPGGDGVNFYLHRADGAFVQLTNTASGGSPWYDECCEASRDFTHVFYGSQERQLPSDPAKYNLYQWVDGNLSLVGVLPGGELAPNGAALAGGALPAVSDDGTQVLFVEGTALMPSSNRALYLREDDQHTVEVSATQRTVDPDPNPPATAHPVGISADGSEVLFNSASELTNNANTGESGGVANHQGSDLYSYDVNSGQLTDLTVDDNPADAATGANVLRVFDASPDASYIYFTAKGDLAPGAISGEENLYVEHDGEIDLIAGGQLDQFGRSSFGSFYVTPEGRHAAFITSNTLTGYDNASQGMVYKYTYKGALECASCRPGGEPPTLGARFGTVGGAARPLSDDGSRLFFESADAIVPRASNGLSNVYEYEGGEVHLLSPGDGDSDAHLLGASASGDDVFIESFDVLSAQEQDSEFGIYDARVDADVFKSAPPICQGEGCRTASTSAPSTPGAGTPNFEGPQEIGVSATKTAKGPKARLRVIVPGSGALKASGKGLKAVNKQASEQGSLTLILALKGSANSKRIHKGVFKSTAELLFTSSSGETSRAEVSIKFEAPATKTGGK